ncbi:MAG: hypothetical protein AMJ42_05240 [Deltaproteobacteria bacterium DG_8]|nr:MAG: hypothetical protein AMJ42_05240 [Deltaproteobacteria bacterium DG_8]
MKHFAVFFLVMIAVLLGGGVGKSFSQNKGNPSEPEIKSKDVKSKTAPALIKPKAKPSSKVVEESLEETKPQREESQRELEEESEVGKRELDEKEKAQIEDLKSRFRKLVEDELEKFSVMGQIVPEEEKEGEGEEVEEEKKAEEAKKEVAVEKREEEAGPKLDESEEDLEEELGEEAEEEGLEEEMPEEILEAIPAEPEKPEEGKEKIALDFEDADIKEVITALADIIGINYIIDPKVRGKVNIHTSGEISVEDVLPILETIFEVNDIAAVKVGNIYKIIPVKEAKKQPLIPQIGKELEDISSPDRLILQIIPLRYIPPKEMEKILKPFLGRGGDIIDYSDRNILIIVDTVYNMKKLLSLVDTVDVSVFDTMHVKFYELENSEAKDLAKELENLFKALGVETKKGKGGEIVSFIPIERMNIILAVSSMPEIFDKVAEWIEKLDEVREELEEQIFIYFVENAKAIDIGDILKEVYGETRREKKTVKTTRTRRTKKGTKTSPKVPTTKTGLATAAGEIKVVVDETNNALIIRATPQDYVQVLKTIKLLDTVPKQVLIEVLIAEVTLDEGTEFGIEWSYKSDYASLGGYKGTESLGQNIDIVKGLSPSGFTYAFVSEALETYLRAYARENKVNILSSPHILAADNTEARIEVGKEVPIVTSEYTPTTLEAGETYSRSIEYRDTGILLTVTPRINEKGLVAMEISQEVSDVSEQRIEGINSPIILKRQAETTLVVQDGRTIAIGGLIREKKDNTMEGIPFLSKLPYLGMIFSYTKEIIEKTELLILITPHVVHTFEQAELITREFKEKVEGLKKILEK